MFKKFRAGTIAIFCMIFLFSCIKKQSRSEVESNLKTAMELYLNHQATIDTARVKFKVLEVSFFEAKMGYICEFKVDMKEKTNNTVNDTTGIMTANVSKDFKEVSRRN
ncbi:MAG TPA: hypothetical protein VIL90_06580 [Puia sp.]|jgi:hypothetical protein